MICQNDVIALEDLNIQGRLKHHPLAGTIADVGLQRIPPSDRVQSGLIGRQIVLADRWAPTSKTYSECGGVQESMPLKVREWTCDGGAHHDRDVNVAKRRRGFQPIALKKAG